MGRCADSRQTFSDPPPTRTNLGAGPERWWASGLRGLRRDTARPSNRRPACSSGRPALLLAPATPATHAQFNENVYAFAFAFALVFAFGRGRHGFCFTFTRFPLLDHVVLRLGLLERAERELLLLFLDDPSKPRFVKKKKKKLPLCPLKKPKPKYHMVKGKRVKVKQKPCRPRPKAKTKAKAKAKA